MIHTHISSGETSNQQWICIKLEKAEIELKRHRSFSTPIYPHEDAMVASKFILQGLISFD